MSRIKQNLDIGTFAENLAHECEILANAYHICKLPIQAPADNSVSEMWSRLAQIIRESAKPDTG